MPVSKNLTKLFSHEIVEYSIGAVLAYYGYLNLTGFLLYALAMQFVHLADFEVVDRTWHISLRIYGKLRSAVGK